MQRAHCRIRKNWNALGRESFEAFGIQRFYADAFPEEVDIIESYYSGSIRMTEFHDRLGKEGHNASMIGSLTYEWAAEQPDAKVILTTRDVDKWVESWNAMGEDVSDLFEANPYLWSRMCRIMGLLYEHRDKVVPTGGFPEKFEDIETLKKGFVKHNNAVMETVPKENLLVFDVRDGWQPLCEFLGVSVPDIPFPRVNERLMTASQMFTLLVITWIWPFLMVLPCFFLYYILHKCWKSGKA